MEALTVQAVPVARLLPMLQSLERDKTDTTDGATTAQDVCGGRADGYLVQLDGVPVMGYALQFAQCSKKRVCWVMAASGHAPGRDLTAEVLPLIEQQARAGGAQQIAITTKRRGLAKKICESGFRESGITYRKNLP